MSPDDIPGFFARRADLDAEAYVELDFTFECAGDPRHAAASLCSEQSTTQWNRVGVEEDYRPRFAAKVVALDARPRPSGFSYDIPNAPHGAVHACRATIAHPHGNFGARLPNLMTSVMGEGTFFAPGIPIIRLEDIRFPASYLAQFTGPKFGVAGIRERLQAFDRPIFIGVIKPNIGLPPVPFADIGEQGLLGGLDIVKDDEMLTDTPWSPLAERAALLGAATARASKATGVPKMYMANITDEVACLTGLHDVAVSAGAGSLLVNALPVGLSGVRLLRAHTTVPLFAHFPFIASFSRLPGYGVHSRVFTRLQRLAGFDAVIMPGFGPRMMMAEHEVLENVRACLEPMGDIRPSLPVPGGSDWAGTIADIHRRVGATDFGCVPGRGVFGHPMGPAAGAASLRQAWDAIAAGVPLDEHAATHEELRRAIDYFGR
jgi:ribulose-bisphosphate carboxylase large chain